MGVKRTCRFALQMSAFDPKPTPTGTFLPFNWVQHYRIGFGGQISALSNYNVAGTLNGTELT